MSFLVPLPQSSGDIGVKGYSTGELKIKPQLSTMSYLRQNSKMDNKPSSLQNRQQLLRLLYVNVSGQIVVQSNIFSLLSQYLTQKVAFIGIHIIDGLTKWNKTALPKQLIQLGNNSKFMDNLEQDTVYLWSKHIMLQDTVLFFIIYSEVSSNFLDFITFLTSTNVLIGQQPAQLRQQYKVLVQSCSRLNQTTLMVPQNLHLFANSELTKPLLLHDDHTFVRCYQWRRGSKLNLSLIRGFQQIIAIQSDYGDWAQCSTDLITSLMYDLQPKHFQKLIFTGSFIVQFLSLYEENLKQSNNSNIPNQKILQNSAKLVIQKIYMQAVQVHIDIFNSHLASLISNQRHIQFQQLWKCTEKAQQMTLDDFQSIRMDNQYYSHYVKQLQQAISNKVDEITQQNLIRGRYIFDSLLEQFYDQPSLIDQTQAIIAKGQQHLELLIMPFFEIYSNTQKNSGQDTNKLKIALKNQIFRSNTTNSRLIALTLKARITQYKKATASVKQQPKVSMPSIPLTTQKSYHIMNQLRILKEKHGRIVQIINQLQNAKIQDDLEVLRLQVRLENTKRQYQQQQQICKRDYQNASVLNSRPQYSTQSQTKSKL